MFGGSFTLGYEDMFCWWLWQGGPRMVWVAGAAKRVDDA